MTVTLTLDLPADLAERVQALPPATLNRYAIATLPGMVDAAEADAGDTEPVDEAFIAELIAADEENDADDVEANLPDDIYLTHPLPPLLTEPLGEALRAGFADIDAGRVTDGETFLARLRQRTGRA